MKKRVLITGTSSGVGYATALLFARNGFHVIATQRKVDKNSSLVALAQQEGLDLELRALDVKDEQAIQSTVTQILQTYETIDILINNAGSGFLGGMEQTTLAQAQEIMDINFFGVWRLTQAVLPSMRKNKAGHIISISSVGGILGQPFNDAYCAAKFAVEGLMESLAPVVKRFGIQVSLVEPGPINSEFASSTLSKSPALRQDLEKDYQGMLLSYTQATMNAFSQYGQTPAEIANILLQVATQEQAKFRYQTSEVSKKMAALKLADSSGDQVIALTGSRLPETI